MEKNASVYSYLRFSDARQSAGSSADRQAQYAARWAKERRLPLDESLSLRDEGLSAHHQRHVKQGALGTFLKAVDEGRIAPGSVLVVEGLDRLSRAEPIQARRSSRRSSTRALPWLPPVMGANTTANGSKPTLWTWFTACWS
jgi:DNA invertase Pin-like site-specific DNA recombinase